MPQCTAKSKRSGVRCQRLASIGRNTCALHGGKSLRGVDSPQFKHGRYSKDVQVAGGKLAERFAEHANDPEYASLRAELALVRSRLSELIERASDGTLSEKDWNKVASLVETLSKASRVELKRLELASRVLTEKEAFALMAAVQQAVLDEVQDTEVRRRIGQRIRVLLTSSGMLSNAVDYDTPDEGPVVVIEQPE